MTPLYTYGRYVVLPTEEHIEEGVTMEGYGVFNTQTNIMEHSSTLLFHAMKWAKICEDQVAAIEGGNPLTNEDLFTN